MTDPRFFSTSAILGTEPELVALPAADFPFFFLLYKKLNYISEYDHAKSNLNKIE